MLNEDDPRRRRGGTFDAGPSWSRLGDVNERDRVGWNVEEGLRGSRSVHLGGPPAVFRSAGLCRDIRPAGEGQPAHRDNKQHDEDHGDRVCPAAHINATVPQQPVRRERAETQRMFCSTACKHAGLAARVETEDLVPLRRSPRNLHRGEPDGIPGRG